MTENEKKAINYAGVALELELEQNNLELNLGQLKNKAAYIASINDLDVEEVFDKLLSATQQLVNKGKA